MHCLYINQSKFKFEWKDVQIFNPRQHQAPFLWIHLMKMSLLYWPRNGRNNLRGGEVIYVSISCNDRLVVCNAPHETTKSCLHVSPNLWSAYAWHNNAQIVYMNSMSFKPPCTITIESNCPHLTQQSPNCCWSAPVQSGPVHSIPAALYYNITETKLEMRWWWWYINKTLQVF
jgi:hypothetical protein